LLFLRRWSCPYIGTTTITEAEAVAGVCDILFRPIGSARALRNIVAAAWQSCVSPHASHRREQKPGARRDEERHRGIKAFTRQTA